MDIELTSPATQREFMRAIRAKPLATNALAELEKYLKRQPTLASLSTVPPWKSLPERFGCADDEKFERRIVASALRRHVDEWIETGVIPGAGEAPLKRDLRKAPGADNLFRNYVEQNPPTLHVSPKYLDYVFVIGRPEMGIGSLASARRHDLVSRAFEETARLFAGSVLSEWGKRLCKCRYRHCGKYFVKRSLRRAPLVQGTFCCPMHQRKASAVDCVTRSRANNTRDLIGEAAAILVRLRAAGPQWWEDRNLKKRLARELSATRLCKRLKLMLRSNWITRHCQSIEKRRLELTST